MSNRLLTNAPKSTFTVAEVKIHTKRRKVRRRSQSTKRKFSLADTSSELLLTKEQTASDKGRHGKSEQRSTQKRSGKSAKRYIDDTNVIRTSTDSLVSTKRSKFYKRPGGKLTAAESSTKITSSGRRKAEKHADKMSRSERRDPDKYSENAPSSKRYRSGKYAEDLPPSQRHTPGRYSSSSEMALSERRSAKKYSNEMSPVERRGADKYSKNMSPSKEHRYDKYPEDLSPSQRRRPGRYSSSREEFEVSGKSGTAGHFKQNYKTDTERRSSKTYSHDDTGGRFKEEGSERKQKYADYANDDEEEIHEKIYIVTRTPSGREIRQPKLGLHPVVTQEQFQNLVEKIRILQTRYGIPNTIPTNWIDLRNTTSITDPRAALNMSARLDAAENKLKQIMAILSQFASITPGINTEADFGDRFVPSNANNILMGAKSHNTREVALRLPGAPGTLGDSSYFEASVSKKDDSDETEIQGKVPYAQFKNALKMLYNDVMKNMHKVFITAGASSEKMGKTIAGTDCQVNAVVKNIEGICKLQYDIEDFGSKVIAIDQNMTSQMSTFQDNLMQMQAELDLALDRLSEALASPKEDPAAVALMLDLFERFATDLNSTEKMQLDLKREIKCFPYSLQGIAETIQKLSKIKCTRDQMNEALSSTLSLKDINGILTQDQFGAVGLNVEQTFQNLHVIIFSKQYLWQQAIDQLFVRFDRSAAIIQVETLNESIQQCFMKMNTDLDEMLTITGPRKEFVNTKKIKRDDNCLSCGTRANVDLCEGDIKLKKKDRSTIMPPATSVNAGSLVDFTRLCIPGRPVPHPIEQSSFICQHDCGKTETNNQLEMIITQLNRTQEYQVHGQKTSCVCLECDTVKTVD